MRLKEAFFSDKKRWISGVLLTLVTAGVVFSTIPLLVYAYFGVALLVAVYEVARFGGVQKSPYLYIIVALIWIGAYFYPSSALELPILALLFTVLPFMLGISKFKTISLILFYPTLSFLAVISLYSMYDKGAWLLFMLFATVAFTDMGAYFGGRSFGKRKLALSISPGKTIEGALVGALCGSVVGFVITILALGSEFGYVEAIILSVSVAVFSIIGDLFESFLKRSVGKKDSGAIFPGHGGMLDRVDGVLFSAVAMYFILKVLS
ncbi:MAG: phosphatidate cytidylyltransferase [Campylobacterales bacterium]